MLLFSCVSREDSELVELDAVHEGNSGMHAKALVGTAIHTDPQILCVHLIHNSVPTGLRLAKDKATEQLISLLVVLDSNVLLDLEGFLEIGKFLLSCFFLVHGLASGTLSRGLISFLTATNAVKAFLILEAVPFCSTRHRMAMMWTRYSLLLPVPHVGIWNFVPLGSSTLICLVFHFL
jgi:hypothetical protein